MTKTQKLLEKDISLMFEMCGVDAKGKKDVTRLLRELNIVIARINTFLICGVNLPNDHKWYAFTQDMYDFDKYFQNSVAGLEEFLSKLRKSNY